MAQVSRPAYDPRCYRLPPHKPLPSREALVLWIGLQPLWQVADIWPLRPADNRPNPCGTQFPHPKTRAAILRQAEPFDCHPKTAPTRLFISMRRSDKKAYHPSPDRVTTIDDGCTNHTHFSTLVQVRPARSILSNALNFCRSAIAALVRSPWRYCPFRLPGGPPLPLAPPCNRQRPFFVAGDRQGFPLLVRAPHCRAVWNLNLSFTLHGRTTGTTGGTM